VELPTPQVFVFSVATLLTLLHQTHSKFNPEQHILKKNVILEVFLEENFKERPFDLILLLRIPISLTLDRILLQDEIHFIPIGLIHTHLRDILIQQVPRIPFLQVVIQ
jgi:hypothetical protein